MNNNSTTKARLAHIRLIAILAKVLVRIMAMNSRPIILFIKQTIVGKRFWFIELGEDLAARLGPCAMYAAAGKNLQVGRLSIASGAAYRKDSEWTRIWTWLWFAIGAARHTWRTSGKPLLFIVTQSPFLPLIGYLRNLLWGQRYVLWVDDVHPEQFTRLGRLREGGLLAGLWHAYNRVVFGRAECIFTLGECMANMLARSLTRTSQRKVAIVPTWVDAEGIKPMPKSENWFAEQHGQVSKLTVLYSGNLGYSHDLSSLLEAARELHNERNIHFVIIGKGPRWGELETFVKRHSLENVTMLPYQLDDVLPYSLAMGDVAVVSLGSGIEGVSMPSKTYYAMAAGSAILGLSDTPSDLELVTRRYQCGLHVAPGDIPGFIGAIKRFYSDRTFLEECRRNARQAAVEEFSRAVNVERVFRAIEPFVVHREFV